MLIQKLSNSFTGELCAAKFVDGQWYRAKVEKSSGSGEVSVLYIDYGNRATIPKAKCGALPGNFVSLPAFAHEYTLALCNLCSDVSKNLSLVYRLGVYSRDFLSIVSSTLNVCF